MSSNLTPSNRANDADAIALLEELRWRGTPVCPYCAAARGWRNNGRWKCGRCKRSFSATVGTIFHHSHIALGAWFALLQLVQRRPGITATDAAEALQLRRPTVGQMLRRLREAGDDSPARPAAADAFTCETRSAG